MISYLINKWKSGKVIKELKEKGLELHPPFSITNLANIKYTPPPSTWVQIRGWS